MKKIENFNDFAESRLDSATRAKFAKSSADSANPRISQEAQGKSRGSIFDEKSGLCSHEQGNRTNGSLTKRVANSPIYRKKTNARAAFGMIFAVILTIIVAGLGILGLKFSTQSLNTTTNEYIAIQLDLYMNSTTEIAILYVQRNGFVCNEGVDCDLGPNNISGQKPGVGKRTPKDPIEKYIEYGDSGEYKFTFKITPLDNYDKYDANEYMQIDDIVVCEAQLAANPTKRCFREDTKNIFLLDIAGSVTNPLTNQTLRVTKRQVIKP